MFGDTGSSSNAILGGGALICRDKGEYGEIDPFDDIKTFFMLLVPPYFLIVEKDDPKSIKIFWALLSLVLYPLHLVYFFGCSVILTLVLAPFVLLMWFLLVA